MITKKQYWNNPYLTEFVDVIQKVEKEPSDPKLMRIQLNSTIFYPEGGGQPSDLGSINDHPVLHVYEENGVIWHIVDAILSPSEEITGIIDWNRRFDHMQQHLGQHLLSALLEKHYQAKTVGFHLGEEYVTIDINHKNLTPIEIDRLETMCNDLIQANLPVSSTVSDAFTENNATTRKDASSPSIQENLRIIEVKDVDRCACGGTHPRQTGEIGLIKILKCENHKDGLRLTFISGKRANTFFQSLYQEMRSLSTSLSVNWQELKMAVDHLTLEKKELFQKNRRISSELADYKAESLYHSSEKIGSHRLLQVSLEDIDPATLDQLINQLKSYKNLIFLVAVLRPSFRIIMGNYSSASHLSMKNVFSETKDIINGKGGGNHQIAQGSGENPGAVNQMLAEARKIIIDHLLQ
ncbi:alanyl-tRNA editing protein [Tindallia californiensis]|uniref:Alanyl-tRNA synthetase n=1 Tax=Tindallia californiensis TaxID=159292 RepID=A0A1H3IV74_9FIRM|nr:DHHA1 domain-containing protein [Tindallia californiensis]SDY31656.1 alanyl-tRNA synthetase [Tindallia californiensis]